MILRFEIEAARLAPAGKLDVCALIRANGHVLGRQVRNGKQHGQQFLADCAALRLQFGHARSEEQTSELQSLMRISYAVFCLKKKKKTEQAKTKHTTITLQRCRQTLTLILVRAH